MKHPVDVHVGKRVRHRRWMVGMTQQQLGDIVGIKFQQIQKYETGANRVSAGRILEIARKLGVDVGYFFEGLSDDDDPGLPLEHGGRQRAAIELVRKFGQIKDPEVRAAIAGLVKTIVDRAN